MAVTLIARESSLSRRAASRTRAADFTRLLSSARDELIWRQQLRNPPLSSIASNGLYPALTLLYLTCSLIELSGLRKTISRGWDRAREEDHLKPLEACELSTGSAIADAIDLSRAAGRVKHLSSGSYSQTPIDPLSFSAALSVLPAAQQAIWQASQLCGYLARRPHLAQMMQIARGP